MITEEQFALKLEEIKEGKRIWDSLMLKFAVENNDIVVLFPHIEEEINRAGSKLLSLFIKKRKPQKALILFTEGAEIEFTDLPSVIYHQMNLRQITCLMTYYSLSDMGHNFIVMSLVKPYGRFGEKVIERNNISISEVVAYGIYGLSKEEASREEISVY